MRYLLANLPMVIVILISICVCFWLAKKYKYIATKRKIKRLIRKYNPQQKEVLSGSELTELANIIIEGKFDNSEAMNHCVQIYMRKKTQQ